MKNTKEQQRKIKEIEELAQDEFQESRLLNEEYLEEARAQEIEEEVEYLQLLKIASKAGITIEAAKLLIEYSKIPGQGEPLTVIRL
jgi:hypothetical protein